MSTKICITLSAEMAKEHIALTADLIRSKMNESATDTLPYLVCTTSLLLPTGDEILRTIESGLAPKEGERSIVPLLELPSFKSGLAIGEEKLHAGFYIISCIYVYPITYMRGSEEQYPELVNGTKQPTDYPNAKSGALFLLATPDHRIYPAVFELTHDAEGGLHIGDDMDSGAFHDMRRFMVSNAEAIFSVFVPQLATRPDVYVVENDEQIGKIAANLNMTFGGNYRQIEI